MRGKMKKKNNTKNKKITPKKPQGKGFYKALLVIAPLAIIALSLVTFFKNSTYFKIAEITVMDDEFSAQIDKNELTRMYKGRNIFEIDISALASRLKKENPFIKYAVVKRILPNRLEIDLVERVPVALVKSRVEYPVDADAMVLPPEAGGKNLVVVTGLYSWTKPRVGTKIPDQNLKIALSLIKLLNEKSVRGVESIDIADARNIALFLQNGIEVKMGTEEFSSRINMLKSILNKKGLDFSNIKYIDLRFKDVVIKPR